MQAKHTQIAQSNTHETDQLACTPNSAIGSERDMNCTKRKTKHKQSTLHSRQLNHPPGTRIPQQKRYQRNIYSTNNQGEDNITKMHTEDSHERHEQNSREWRPVKIIVVMIHTQIMSNRRDNSKMKLTMQKC